MLNQCKLQTLNVWNLLVKHFFLILAVEINTYISNEIKRAGMPDNMQGCIWLFLAIPYKQAMVMPPENVLNYIKKDPNKASIPGYS